MADCVINPLWWGQDVQIINSGPVWVRFCLLLLLKKTQATSWHPRPPRGLTAHRDGERKVPFQEARRKRARWLRGDQLGGERGGGLKVHGHPGIQGASYSPAAPDRTGANMAAFSPRRYGPGPVSSAHTHTHAHTPSFEGKREKRWVGGTCWSGLNNTMEEPPPVSGLSCSRVGRQMRGCWCPTQEDGQKEKGLPEGHGTQTGEKTSRCSLPNDDK